MIRKCKVSEIALVEEFYDGVVKYLDEHVNYPKWTYKAYPSVHSVQAMTKAGCQYVYLQQGNVVAAFVLNTDPQGDYEAANWSRHVDEGDYLVCHTLAVAPDMQGKGIGKQVVQFCINFAKEHRYAAVRLDVVPTNLPARKLYESCGFRYVGNVDLKRGIRDIPLFSMYELNL